MDKQRCDPFRAIKPEIRNKAIEQPRSLSMSVEMWMEMNGRFWNHVNLANQTCSSSNCLYFMLFCFNISFPHFYHHRHHFFLFWFTADLSGHNVASCATTVSLFCNRVVVFCFSWIAMCWLAVESMCLKSMQLFSSKALIWIHSYLNCEA